VPQRHDRLGGPNEALHVLFAARKRGPKDLHGDGRAVTSVEGAKNRAVLANRQDRSEGIIAECGVGQGGQVAGRAVEPARRNRLFLGALGATAGRGHGGGRFLDGRQVCGGLHQRVGHQLEVCFTDHDSVARQERSGRTNALVVDDRARLAAEVENDHSARLDVESELVTGHVRVAELDFDVVGPAETHRPVKWQRELLALVRAGDHLEGQFRAACRGTALATGLVDLPLHVLCERFETGLFLRTEKVAEVVRLTAGLHRCPRASGRSTLTPPCGQPIRGQRAAWRLARTYLRESGNRRWSSRV
jgi:hypothetical protein